MMYYSYPHDNTDTVTFVLTAVLREVVSAVLRRSALTCRHSCLASATHISQVDAEAACTP